MTTTRCVEQRSLPRRGLAAGMLLAVGVGVLVAWWGGPTWGALAGVAVLAAVLVGGVRSYLRPIVGEGSSLVRRADEAVAGITSVTADPAAEADTFFCTALLAARSSRETLVRALVALHHDEKAGREETATLANRRRGLELQVVRLEELLVTLQELLEERHWLESTSRAGKESMTAARVAAERTEKVLEEARKRSAQHRNARRLLEEGAGDDVVLDLVVPDSPMGLVNR